MTAKKDNTTSSAPAGPACPGRSGSAAAGGFTLVELLVVIAIIALLLLIGAPSAVQIQKDVARKKSVVMLAQISTALRLYAEDFDGKFPPSSNEGGQAICRLLTGFPGDGGNDQTPGANDNAFKTDDGCEGYGFRLATRGPVLGPYYGVQKLPTSGGSTPRFVDAFRREVMYYRFNENTTAPDYGYYENNDNTNDTGDINGYARNSAGAAGEFYRKDFLLITSGPDGMWTFPRDPKSDDITNFK